MYTLKLLKSSLLRDETVSIIDQNSHLYHLELKKVKAVRIFLFELKVREFIVTLFLQG
jgi:hypothetical protein